MDHHFDFLKNLVAKGGPDAQDFYDLDAWIAEIAEHASNGWLTTDDFGHLRKVLGETISVETMQGFVFQKPHGYAGDYEIIDGIYMRYVSDKAHLFKRDVYMQDHAACHAVRNRVQYFCQLLENNLHSTDYAGGVLNLASGPGRDMLQFFEHNPDAQAHFDCIEQDQNAVDHAKALCKDSPHKTTFHVKNALRFQSKKKYGLIWSAGLFDYFDDKVFVFMLRKLGTMVAEGGEIVIGNFSPTNPSRAYMELFEWHLHHRSPPSLKALAVAAGFAADQVSVEKESTGVNLFLHIKLTGFREAPWPSARNTRQT